MTSSPAIPTPIRSACVELGSAAFACLELGSAAQPAGAAVWVHEEAAHRICPEALAARHRLRGVVARVAGRSGGTAAGFMPAVQSVRGGIPKFEPGRRVDEPGIVLVQAQVFGPELEPEPVRQWPETVVAIGCAGRLPVVDSRVEYGAGELAVVGPGPAVEVV